jgi:hypothetical protein
MKRLLGIAAMVAALTVLPSFSPVLAAIPNGTTVLPTPAPSPLAHMPVGLQVAGCFHNTSGTCPAPTVSVAADWSNICKHLTHVETDQRITNVAAGSGCIPFQYHDNGLIHGSLIASYPQSITARDNGALPIFAPNTNSSTGGSMVGEYGNNYGAYYNQRARFDDTLAPWQFANNGILFCGGTWVVTSGGHVCSDGGATTETTANYDGLQQQPYPHPFPQRWLDGFHRFMSAMPLPVMLNPLTDPTFRDYWKVLPTDLWAPKNYNIATAQCEVCVTDNGYASDIPFAWNIWFNHENAGVVAEEDGLEFELFNVHEKTTGDMIFTYASVMLYTLDPKLSIIEEQWDSPLTAPTSTVNISNLTYLVPYGAVGPDPRFDPAVSNYSPLNPSPTVGIGVFQQPGGAYAREFAHCTINGVDQGACASVVNPYATIVPYPASTLTQTYTRTITANANGVMYEFGDNSSTVNLPSISASLPANSMPAHSAQIVFL